MGLTKPSASTLNSFGRGVKSTGCPGSAPRKNSGPSASAAIASTEPLSPANLARPSAPADLARPAPSAARTRPAPSATPARPVSSAAPVRALAPADNAPPAASRTGPAAKPKGVGPAQSHILAVCFSATTLWRSSLESLLFPLTATINDL